MQDPKFKGNKKKILVLDDEPYNIEVLKSIFLALKLENIKDTL